MQVSFKGQVKEISLETKITGLLCAISPAINSESLTDAEEMCGYRNMVLLKEFENTIG